MAAQIQRGARAVRAVLLLCPAVILASATAAPAQDAGIANPAGSLLGQRQARDQAAQGIAPMARISNRVQNRIQSRLRNRIDRDYSAQSDAASSVERADQQSRIAGQPRSR